MKIDFTKAELKRLRQAILLAINSEEVYLESEAYLRSFEVLGGGWGIAIEDIKGRIKSFNKLLDKIE